MALRKLKEEALDRTRWRTRFGRGYGPIVRQTMEWMNEWMNISIFNQGLYQPSIESYLVDPFRTYTEIAAALSRHTISLF